MKTPAKYFVPRTILATVAVVLFVVQSIFGDFPVWFFAAPMNLLIGALWLLAIYESYRHHKTSIIVEYLLSAEATYIALFVAALIAIIAGMQHTPKTTSWPIVGGAIFILTVLALVILRGWRNKDGIRWCFLITHCGLWIALVSMLFGAPDKHIFRVQVGETTTREAVNEQGKRAFLSYELRLEDFELEQSGNGSPKQFRATIAIDERVVDIEVNSPYSQRYGEDIYLVSYDSEGCVLQIVREPWRMVTLTGIAMLLLGAMMLFLQGFQNKVR